jgi:hypothetical protein
MLAKHRRTLASLAGSSGGIMFKIVKADKDTYLTDKIVSRTRVKDANVGLAGTLDLFYLYDESTLSGTTNPQEVSRLLIHFDLDPLRALTGSKLDVNDPSFNVTMKLFDVYGGQPTPSNFTLIAHPLSQSFDEGVGRDTSSFRDLDAANFITASIVSGVPVVWNAEGANSSGTLGAVGIDIIETGDLLDGGGSVSLTKTQVFTNGEEHLELDVTNVVSATLAGNIPDYGWRISFLSASEAGTNTLFVKRFSSRHSTNPRITPRLLVKFNDAIQDDHENFFFDLSGSLFLRNLHRGIPANILSGTALTSVTGSNSLILRLTSGTLSGSSGSYFEQIVTASQSQLGDIFQTGVYKADFAISSEATASLKQEIINAGSGTFTEIWGSLDGTVGYHTGTLVVKSIQRTSFQNVSENDVIISVPNLKPEYRTSETPRFRVFAKDDNRDNIRVSKFPRESKSILFRQMHYRIRDSYTDTVIIPFDTTNNSTLMSTDSDGMYFDLAMDSFDPGSVYEIEIQFSESGTTRTFTADRTRARFRVVE